MSIIMYKVHRLPGRSLTGSCHPTFMDPWHVLRHPDTDRQQPSSCRRPDHFDRSECFASENQLQPDRPCLLPLANGASPCQDVKLIINNAHCCTLPDETCRAKEGRRLMTTVCCSFGHAHFVYPSSHAHFIPCCCSVSKQMC